MRDKEERMIIDFDASLQDFFIYVPGSAVPAQLADASVEIALCADVPPDEAMWVKIPLTEKLVVYVRMATEEKHVALC